MVSHTSVFLRPSEIHKPKLDVSFLFPPELSALPNTLSGSKTLPLSLLYSEPSSWLPSLYSTSDFTVCLGAHSADLGQGSLPGRGTHEWQQGWGLGRLGGWWGDTEFKSIPPSNPVGSGENMQFPWQPIKFPRYESPPPPWLIWLAHQGSPPGLLCCVLVLKLNMNMEVARRGPPSFK